MFHGCTSLTSAVIGTGVKRIQGAGVFLAYGVFDGCNALTHVAIPTGVTTIERGAFRNCTSLTNVRIPSSVDSLAPGAFLGCSSLAAIEVDPGSPFYRSLEGVVFDRKGSTLIAFPGGKAGSDHIPDTASSIADEAFQDCTGLTRVTVPSCVTSIGNNAFGGCTGLSSIDFEGNAPAAQWSGLEETEATIRYLPGTQGWTSTLAGRPTAPWVRPNPTILDFGAGFGPSPAGFGFVISWATNVPVVVEASADLSGAGWTPISTSSLTEGRVHFTDPDWKNRSARFYRLRQE